jgi:y4mF family transcriptional regulator
MAGPNNPLDALAGAATELDALRRMQELIDPPHLRELRRQQELLAPFTTGAVGQALAAHTKLREQVGDLPKLAERYRSPARDAIDALGGSQGVQRMLADHAKLHKQLGDLPELAKRYSSPVREAIDALGGPEAAQRLLAGPQAQHSGSPVRRAVDVPGKTPGLRRMPAPAAPALPGASTPAAISVADIGRRVREARRAMGMTQQRFADLAGVGRRFLVELEQGKASLEIGRVLAVCKAAGITLAFAK